MTHQNHLIQPGHRLDWYPETREEELDYLQRLFKQVKCKIKNRQLTYRMFVKTAILIENKIKDVSFLSPAALDNLNNKIRADLRNSGFTDDNLITAFALVNIHVKRKFGFYLHREQLFCAWILLHGALPEMATGEGKSITAALTAIVAALSGVPVHVISTNDYLVERDAESMRKLFECFTLSSGHVTSEQQEHERMQGYACDICYVSNKQLVFDYLRDRQTFGNRPSSIDSRVQGLYGVQTHQPLLRGLCFAIVDEADSVFIDDAITPLILSQQIDGEKEFVQSVTAISLAKRLSIDDDYKIDKRSNRVIITEQGENQLAALASGLVGTWNNCRFRLENVRQALTALCIFVKDKDYIIRDGKVILLDQSTGRVMPDRKLQHGLQQMLEAKEKCELSGQSETIASLSFQNFFIRYKHLCGMTGTGKEAAKELLQVYRQHVIEVPTHNPSIRIKESPKFCLDENEYMDCLLKEVQHYHAIGRPVLVGTRSLAHSERISECLQKNTIQHQLLTARQDEEEANIVANAGKQGVVTIATNIAGRGTDIPLSNEVKEQGGLHVIVAELNDNQRIDRQLIGRGARQGDPGSYRYIISLQDDMLSQNAPQWALNLLQSKYLTSKSYWHQLCKYFSEILQTACERKQAKLRKQVAHADKEMNARLSFSGYKE
ncbi:MAG: prepilin peptidase [Gammaproteobacteria bacterium]